MYVIEKIIIYTHRNQFFPQSPYHHTPAESLNVELLKEWNSCISCFLVFKKQKNKCQFPPIIYPYTLDRLIRFLSWNQQSQSFPVTVPHIWYRICRIYFILNLSFMCFSLMPGTNSVLHKFHVLHKVEFRSPLIIITVKAKHPLSINNHCPPR